MKKIIPALLLWAFATLGVFAQDTLATDSEQLYGSTSHVNRGFGACYFQDHLYFFARINHDMYGTWAFDAVVLKVDEELKVVDTLVLAEQTTVFHESMEIRPLFGDSLLGVSLIKEDSLSHPTLLLMDTSMTVVQQYTYAPPVNDGRYSTVCSFVTDTTVIMGGFVVYPNNPLFYPWYCVQDMQGNVLHQETLRESESHGAISRIEHIDKGIVLLTEFLHGGFGQFYLALLDDNYQVDKMGFHDSISFDITIWHLSPYRIIEKTNGDGYYLFCKEGIAFGIAELDKGFNILRVSNSFDDDADIYYLREMNLMDYRRPDSIYLVTADQVKDVDWHIPPGSVSYLELFNVDTLYNHNWHVRLGDGISHYKPTSVSALPDGGALIVCMKSDWSLNPALHSQISIIKVDRFGHTVGEMELGAVPTRRLSVYPNPTEGRLTVEGLPARGEFVYSITDISGKAQGRGTLEDRSSIDLETLSPGTYFLEVHDRKSGRLYSARVLKK